MEEVLGLLLLALVFLGPAEAYHRQEQDAYAAEKGSSGPNDPADQESQDQWSCCLALFHSYPTRPQS